MYYTTSSWASRLVSQLSAINRECVACSASEGIAESHGKLAQVTVPTILSDKTVLNLGVLVRIADDTSVDDGKIGLLIFEYFVSQ